MVQLGDRDEAVELSVPSGWLGSRLGEGEGQRGEGRGEDASRSLSIASASLRSFFADLRLRPARATAGPPPCRRLLTSAGTCARLASTQSSGIRRALSGLGGRLRRSRARGGSIRTGDQQQPAGRVFPRARQAEQKEDDRAGREREVAVALPSARATAACSATTGGAASESGAGMRRSPSAGSRTSTEQPSQNHRAGFDTSPRLGSGARASRATSCSLMQEGSEA